MYITGICDNEEQLLAQGFETGKAAGLEEGFTTGKAEGLEEGFESGFTKAKQILRMYNDGKSPDEIATLLDISVDQVKEMLGK